MPTTRKRVIKTVYKDEDDSEPSGDFSDSGSEAKISDVPSSDEEDIEEDETSSEEFKDKFTVKKNKKQTTVGKKTKFAKNFINKLNKSSDPNETATPILFSVKDLTDADKLLPSVLNLSESDSSDDESSKVHSKNVTTTSGCNYDSESDAENKTEYKDVWSTNIQENSAEIAKKAFMELEQHKSKIEETKVSIQNYTVKTDNKGESNVIDLLAQGEEILPPKSPSKKKHKGKKNKHDSDSDLEDWEEVKDAKGIPQQGLQLVVDFPDAVSRKTKKLDVEMMMKRKINRVKKEYQVYMHKVHVLCWLGHGNFVSRVLNDQEVMAAALSLVPSKDCYPGERVDMKYVEQITKWYKDKFTIKEDKNEDKFRPKAPPLKNLMLGHIKSKVVTSRKYLVYIFISMLRALGLQCRIMFNFVTVPIKPPTSELCSLSTKSKDTKEATNVKEKRTEKIENKKKGSRKEPNKSKLKISQMDGNCDGCWSSDTDFDDLMQVDGANDATKKTRGKRSARKGNNIEKKATSENEDVSPPKRSKKSPSPKSTKSSMESKKTKRTRNNLNLDGASTDNNVSAENMSKIISPRKTRKLIKTNKQNDTQKSSNSKPKTTKKIENVPHIVIKKENPTSSKYFETEKPINNTKRLSLSRNKSNRATTSTLELVNVTVNKDKTVTKAKTKSNSSQSAQKSKYFENISEKASDRNKTAKKLTKKEEIEEDKQRVSHKDLLKSKQKKIKKEVEINLIDIIKNRIKEAKEESKKRKVKGKAKKESDEDSDYLSEEAAHYRNSDSDDDFKPKKISPKASTSRKIDRRVISSDEDKPINRTNIWCEVFVEELEQWVAIDIVKSQVHCVSEIYGRMTHPACYIVGWDNNNYLKDLTRRYVPHWNTVTRKQRVDSEWWNKALQPWLGPKTARDREEDECLDRMQLEAPLPKSITEFKNHPLYALKRHLLKFEAIYPPDAATLGFVRGEPVYSRDCVYTCRSRDIWLKEAKVVRLGEQPYKIVKSRPKWDRLSNKLITDKPLEIFGPWQVQEYEPPVAENGKVPRNAYGNVELFKECMLPKGTVHIKLPGLNRVAKKLNIDCAPAMIGFDFNGGWSHPVYDGFVVCEEFEETITEAWLKDQEELERREREKTDSRVYGNWKRLIKGMLIRERLKDKYGFENLKEDDSKKKAKGPRVVAKKR